MRPGKLRHSIEIQQPTETDDGGGSYVPSWAKVCDTRAEIADPLPHEKISAEKMEHSITHVITIRYRPGITAEMRIVFGSRYFYIKSIANPQEANRWLVMTAQEKS